MDGLGVAVEGGRGSGVDLIGTVGKNVFANQVLNGLDVVACLRLKGRKACATVIREIRGQASQVGDVFSGEWRQTVDKVVGRDEDQPLNFNVDTQSIDCVLGQVVGQTVRLRAVAAIKGRQCPSAGFFWVCVSWGQSRGWHGGHGVSKGLGGAYVFPKDRHQRILPRTPKAVFSTEVGLRGCREPVGRLPSRDV